MLNADPAAVFAALGDPTRLSLLTRLNDGQARSISALSGETHLTRQAVTKHLRVLEGAGLVRSRRIGREAQFSQRPETLDDAKAYLDQVAGQWDAALSRLKGFVED